MFSAGSFDVSWCGWDPVQVSLNVGGTGFAKCGQAKKAFASAALSSSVGQVLDPVARKPLETAVLTGRQTGRKTIRPTGRKLLIKFLNAVGMNPLNAIQE
jgi:hypothetical protein